MPDITLSASPALAARLAHCLGRQRGFVDAQGNSRDATAAEIKQEAMRNFRQIITSQERIELEAAIPDVVIAPVDFS